MIRSVFFVQTFALLLLAFWQTSAASAAGIGSKFVQQFSYSDEGVSIGDAIGTDIAISGDTAVVGAPMDDAVGRTDAGSAYILVQQGSQWIKQAKLRADDFSNRLHFGSCVAISGDTAVIGASPDNYSSYAGAVYVFVRNGTAWSQQARIETSSLPANSVAYGNTFPAAVAISGDTLIMSAASSTAYSSAVFVFTRTGTTWQYQATLLSNPNSYNTGYGSSLSLSGNTIAVGAAQMTVNGKTSAGAVFVYTGSGHTWTQQATILASDASTSYLFGTSVAIEGDTLLVGSPGRSSNQGAGYLFSRSSTVWSETTKLTGPLSSNYNQGAGKKVSLSGSVAVLTFSTPSYNYSSTSTLGWVFSKSGSTWGSAIPLASTPTLYNYGNTLKSAAVAANGTSVLLAKQSIYLSPNFTDEINAFANSTGQWSVATKVNLPASGTIELGASVWVKGGEALVGAPGDADSSTKNTGSVLVLAFEDGGWSLKQKLTPIGGNDGLLFGKAVARDGDIMVVSANSTAYVFEIYNDAWVQTAVLSAGDGSTDQGFGYSVAVLGNTIVVGAPFKNSNAGEAYVFTRGATGWAEAARLAPADLQTGELFGSSVALTGGMAIVGTPGTPYSGSVQVFQGGASKWLRTSKLLPPAGAGTGFGGVLTVNNDRLLVAATYYDEATSLTMASASGFTLKSGRWQNGGIWMRCVNASPSSIALDGDFAMLAGPANSYYDVKFTTIFAKRSTGWEPVDQIPGGAAALSGSTFLIGDTAPSSDKPESGCATFYAPAAVLSIDSYSSTAGIDSTLAVDLGYLVTGKTYTRTFTLRNTGAMPLTGLQVTIEGATPADAVVSPLKTTTLAPGASTVLTLTVQPSTANFDIALKIHGNGGNSSVLTLLITASVTETGIAPTIIAEPGQGIALNDPSWTPSDITLIGDAQGSAPLSFQWKFNGRAIAGATGNTLKLGAPSIKLLGTFTLEVTNPYGKATTAPTTFFWIQPAPKPLNLTLNEGATLVLKAPVRGAASVPWYFNSPANSYQILDDQRTTGASTAQLVLRNLQPADSGDYLVVLGSSQPVIAHVTVRARPRVDPGALPPNSTFTWHVGSAVFGGPFLSGDATTRYSATGLPPGVTINPVYGTLSGRPTVAGSYRPSFSATNAAGGSTPVKMIATVTGLDELLVGTHVGLVTPDDVITASLGGTITFTVTSSGAITGSALVGSKPYRFSTRFIDNPDTSIPYLYCKAALAARPDGKVLSLLLLENDQPSGNEISGVLLLEDSTSSQNVVFETARQQTPAAQAFNPTGSYNVRLNARDPFDPSLPEPPKGTGYLQIKGSRTAFTFAGKLSDGTVVSGSAPVLKTERPGFAIPMHQALYSATGFVQGWLALTTDEVTDYDLQWSKDTAVHRSGTAWPDGFSRTYIGATGGKYTPPARGQRLFGLTGGTIAFDKTVLPVLTVSSDFDFTLNTANVPTLTLLPGNALRPALTINAATGLFSGAINVIAGSPATTRRIAFSGVLQEDFTPESGKGGFVLPPESPTGLSTSGDVWFNPRQGLQ